VKQLKVGVIGCGLIAQHMHLPHLSELRERFEIHALCDVSQPTLEYVGEKYHVSRRYTDYRDLLAADVDAVLVLLSASPGEVLVAAAQAGKHILVEKPLAYSVPEAEDSIAAAEAAGVKLMVAYMKRYDPGYLYGRDLIQGMQTTTLIRSHDVLGPLDLTLREVNRIYRGNDVPDRVKQHQQDVRNRRFQEAIGDVSPEIARAYGTLLGLSIHDMAVLRGALGDPLGVIAFDIWDGGGSYCGVHEVSHMRIKVFDEELAVYGHDAMVRIAFPNPYLKNAPTTVTAWSMEGDDFAAKEVIASYEEAFYRELIHFHECIVQDKEPLTPAWEAKKDVALAGEMIRAYTARAD
jgi:predicted dehydrogenase